MGTIWYLTNELNDKSSVVHSLLVDGTETNDNNAIVNAFNKHFSNSGKDVKRQIPTVDKSYRDYLQKKKSVEKLLLNPITETEILKAINLLHNKHSPRFNKISNSFVKSLKNSLE